MKTPFFKPSDFYGYHDDHYLIADAANRILEERGQVEYAELKKQRDELKAQLESARILLIQAQPFVYNSTHNDITAWLEKSGGEQMSKVRYTHQPNGCYDKEGKFEQDCDSCGATSIVYTQEDRDPEYYTTIFTQCCKCGKELKWSLPVN